MSAADEDEEHEEDETPSVSFTYMIRILSYMTHTYSSLHVANGSAVISLSSSAGSAMLNSTMMLPRAGRKARHLQGWAQILTTCLPGSSQPGEACSELYILTLDSLARLP